MSRWILTVAGGVAVELSGSSQTLGRESTCDISLGDGHPSVSRQHARLEPTPAGVQVTDLGSTNGTRLNGLPVAPVAIARHGDVLEFGQVRAVLKDAEQEYGAPGVATTTTQVAPPPVPWAQTASPEAQPAYPVSYSQAPPPAPVGYGMPYTQEYPPVHGPQPGSGLSTTGMVMGIVVACIAVVGLVPCFGWLNWFTLMLGGISKILCIIALFTEGRFPPARNRAVIGLVVTISALFIGGIRLVLGAGCL